MEIKVCNSPVKGPEASLEKWEFLTQVRSKNGESNSQFQIDDIDLQRLVVRAIGRSLDNSGGVKSQKSDLNANWEKIEPLLIDHMRKWFEANPDAVEGVA